MREVLELSKETYNLLVNVAKQRQRSLEEMLRICLVAYEERSAVLSSPSTRCSLKGRS